uniref:Lipid scramblase CLPTM1L n=1 Tax=Cyprinus carpio TaxID=7962 RepID=A0A8C2KNQ9_CYPCA
IYYGLKYTKTALSVHQVHFFFTRVWLALFQEALTMLFLIKTEAFFFKSPWIRASSKSFKSLVCTVQSRISLNVMLEDFTSEKKKKKFYLPLLLVDELRSRLNDLIVSVPLTISYDTITLRKFRIWIYVQAVIYSLKHFGFSEQNLDEIKAMFVDSGLHVLALSVLVPAFHNDIQGFSSIVIFLHLLEEQSSWLILLPTGISALIELWKVKKVLTLSPKFHASKIHKKTFSATVYVCFIMLSTLNSWYSWITNGVYAFGFLSMVPQLFINYIFNEKSIFLLIKSGLNTFISDVFSGIITTPGPHQLACFRDDVVFLIYLCQHSKSRSCDYGASHRKKPKGKPHEE